MPQIFPKWSNTAVKLMPLVLAGGLCLTVFVVWYWFSPWNTDVGYEPTQPLPFSHKKHASDLGIDCLYCHRQAENTPFAGVPSVETCMNCHQYQANKDLLSLAPLMDSWHSSGGAVAVAGGGSGGGGGGSAGSDGGFSLPWTRIHKVPDYAYFDHSAHINVGIGCVSCHGQINEMHVVRQTKPLSMAWCLECHRNPAPHLRPVDQVANMNYQQTDAHQRMAIEKANTLNAPVESCSGCHR